MESAWLRRDRRTDAWARAYAVALFVHALLPDFDERDWTLPRVAHVVAAAAIMARPCAAAFALALGATLWPLFGLRDVLTQSMYLAWVAAAATAGLAAARPRFVLDAVRLLTAGTYLLAALHKVNRDFLDPAVSCAQHAWAQFVAHYPALPSMDGEVALPALVVVQELAIAVLILRRHALMWPLGLLFHLPITVTFEPAFGLVMISGYVATVTPRQAVRWRRGFRRRWGIAAGAAAVIAADTALHGALASPITLLKLAAAGAIAVAWLSAARRPWYGPAAAGRAASLLGAAWLAHGLTPYLGLQVQHTAAMLSNLRVDPGCHNSLLVPEGLRLVDPYVRIDEAAIGAGRPPRERALRETLWNLTALHTMRRNWCIPENRPIRIAGTWRGREFAVADLCADDWEASFPGPFGAGFLPDFQALQKNLPRACPSACIH